MIAVLNILLLLLLAAAAVLGVSALVQKRTVRRGRERPPTTHAGNHAS